MSDGPKKIINKITKGFAKHGYICSDQISTAVYLASELEKPAENCDTGGNSSFKRPRGTDEGGVNTRVERANLRIERN